MIDTQSHVSKILVCMPNYNGSMFLSESIETILKQTYTNIELHIFDNTSSDSSVDIINHFISIDSRIILHTSELNIGLVENYLKIFTFVKKSNFKRFAIVQSDDKLDKSYLESLSELLDRNSDAAIAVSSIAAVDTFGKIIRYNKSYDRFNIRSKTLRKLKYIFENESTGKCNIHIGLLNQVILDEINLERVFIGMDFDFIISWLFVLKSRIISTKKVLYFKRRSLRIDSESMNHYDSRNKPFYQGHLGIHQAYNLYRWYLINNETLFHRFLTILFIAIRFMQIVSISPIKYYFRILEIAKNTFSAYYLNLNILLLFFFNQNVLQKQGFKFKDLIKPIKYFNSEHIIFSSKEEIIVDLKIDNNRCKVSNKASDFLYTGFYIDKTQCILHFYGYMIENKKESFTTRIQKLDRKLMQRLYF